jgi:hypothetical protein
MVKKKNKLNKRNKPKLNNRYVSHKFWGPSMYLALEECPSSDLVKESHISDHWLYSYVINFFVFYKIQPKRNKKKKK